jgi:hypothetical protein
MPYGRPDQGGAAPSELGYDPDDAPILQNWQIQGNILFQTEDFSSGVWVQSGVFPPAQNTAALQGPNGSGSFWEVTSGGATSFIGQSRSPAVPFNADSLYYSIVIAGGPGATSNNVGVFAQAVLEGKAQTVVINPANGTIVSQTGNADEVVLSSVEIAGRLFTTVTIRLDNISTFGNSLDLRVLPDTSGGSGVAIIGSPMIAESITDGIAGAIPRAPAYVLSSSGSQNGQHFAGKFPRIQVNDAMESHEWDYTSAPTYVAGDQTLGRVIRPVGGTGAFTVQIGIPGFTPGGLANGFYFFIDPSALNSATDSVTLTAGATILVFESFAPTNLGNSGIVWNATRLTSAPLLLVVRNDADTESNAVYRVYPMGTLGGGGGVARPAGEVVFGTGAGVTSVPGVAIIPSLGAIALGPLPDSVLGIALDVGNRTTAGGGAPITGNAGNGFAGGAGGFIAFTTGSGNGAGLDGDFILSTGNAAPVERLRVVGETGDWNLAANAGLNRQAIISQGPGLPPVWGSPLQVFIGSFSRDMALGAGSQIVSGIGFTPRVIFFFSGTNNFNFFLTPPSIGAGFVGSNAVLDLVACGPASIAIYFTDTTSEYFGVVSAIAAGQFTITWTVTVPTTGILVNRFLALG